MKWPQRFVDLQPEKTDHVLQRARDLLSSAEATAASELEQRRVYRAVLTRRDQRTRGSLFRPALVVGATLLFGTVAGATVARKHVVALLGGWAETPDTKPIVPRANSTKNSVELPLPKPQETLVNEAPSPPKAAKNKPVVRPRKLAKIVDPQAHAAFVIDATRALRIEKAPARAVALLRSYIELAPSGSLIEEAYGLALEAAQAQGPNESKTWARAYLVKFPGGRFVNQAERLLARDKP
jgi:hypothetical protein